MNGDDLVKKIEQAQNEVLQGMKAREPTIWFSSLLMRELYSGNWVHIDHIIFRWLDRQFALVPLTASKWP